MADASAITARQKELVEQAIERARPTVKDRVVVVTGGGRGIGRAMVEGLWKAGAMVVAADKTWKGAEEFRQQLESSGRGMGVEVDITDDEQLDAAFEAVTKRFGAADALINNAALVGPTLYPGLNRKKTLETTDRDWEVIFNVNVFGVLKTIRRFIKPMLERKSGSVVNLVSRGALAVSAGSGYFGMRPWTVEMPYQSTKAAVMALTFYLADEVRSEGVAVNAIMPAHARGSWFDSASRASMERGDGFGQRPEVPEHVVPITLFLASQNAQGVTGMLYSVADWNHDHGYGGYAAWQDHELPPDLEESFSKAEAASRPARGGFGVSTPANRV
ncbi:MAG TPA: SDR family oxidoreductase [Chloroflexota bacterium]